MKRCFDLICSSTGIIILLPIFIIISIFIKITSAGPVIFKQKRVGQYGKQFDIFKFRSMKINAEKLGPKITIGKDSRITYIGKILRKSKLDELPQLFNVLLGNMSIVGPRPEVPEYVKLYDSEIRDEVLSVRPGITDYASILMIDESLILGKSINPHDEYINKIMPEKLALNIKYIQEQSFLLDLKIIFLTIFKIFCRQRYK